MDSDNDGDESAPSISLSKSNPDVAAMFKDCQPGEAITLTIGYNGQSVDLPMTVGEDDEDTFSASAAEPEEGAAGGGEEEEEEPGASSGGGVAAGTAAGASGALGAPPVNSAVGYIKSKRK